MFSTPLRTRTENVLGLRINGYDSTTVKLPQKREHSRYILKKFMSTSEKIHYQIKHTNTVASQIGPINKAHVPFAPARTPRNEKNGIIKRLIHEHKLPDKSLCEKLTKYVESEILPHIKPLPPGASREELEKDWYADCSYSRKRKDALHDLYEQYTLRHGTDWTYDLLRCKMFTKEELYWEKKHARLIISRNDTFKAIIGPYAHAFDKELFHGYFARNFVKGKDSQWKVNRMKEISSSYANVLETDYSSFEGSQSRRIQDAIELPVFRRFFMHHPDILDLIEMTYEDRRYEDLSCKELQTLGIQGLQPYIFSRFHGLGLVGNRKSGEMWTSSGNGLLNLTIMKFLAHSKHIGFDGIVEGDDGFFGVTQTAIDSDDYAKLGFTIKLCYATDENDLSFCGLRFASDGTFMIDPERTSRIGWNEKKKYFMCNKKTKLQLLKARAMSMLSEAPNCPVTSIMAYSIIKGIHASPKFDGLDWWDRRIYEENKHNKFSTKPVITTAARIAMGQMFGLGPVRQESLEKSFMSDWFSDFRETIRPDLGDYSEEGLITLFAH